MKFAGLLLGLLSLTLSLNQANWVNIFMCAEYFLFKNISHFQFLAKVLCSTITCLWRGVYVCTNFFLVSSLHTHSLGVSMCLLGAMIFDLGLHLSSTELMFSILMIPGLLCQIERTLLYNKMCSFR